MNENIDLGKTQITDKIRVSSAAIFYDEVFGRRYQIETFIFSDDPKISTQQIIHGDCYPFNPLSRYVLNCQKVHEYISNNLKQKLNK